MGDSPSGSKSIGNGDTSRKSATVKCSLHLLGQRLLAAEEQSQVGHIREQAIGSGNTNGWTELLTPLGELLEHCSIGQRIVLFTMRNPQRLRFGQRHADGNALPTGLMRTSGHAKTTALILLVQHDRPTLK